MAINIIWQKSIVLRVLKKFVSAAGTWVITSPGGKLDECRSTCSRNVKFQDNGFRPNIILISTYVLFNKVAMYCFTHLCQTISSNF